MCALAPNFAAADNITTSSQANTPKILPNVSTGSLPPSFVTPAPIPTIALPAGYTVKSIITEIVKHGNLHDSDYINHLFGTPVTHVGHRVILFQIPQTSPLKEFQVTYHTQIPWTVPEEERKAAREKKPNNLDSNISLDFYKLEPASCLKPEDFQSLFDQQPTISHESGEWAAYDAYTFKKVLDTQYDLYLSVSYNQKVSPCASAMGLLQTTKHLTK